MISAAAAESGRMLDKLNFGDSESEQRHRFESMNTEVPDGKPAERPELYISSVKSTAGAAGWLEYELSQPTALGKIRLNWEAPRNNYFFEIQTSLDGDDWKKVYSGKSRGEITECQFDPVKARYVRIMRGGADRWWRSATWRLAKIQFEESPFRDAYREPYFVYEPALGESCRRLLSDKSPGDAWMNFRMKTDPDKQNYLTVKFWGGDAQGTNLRLCDEDGNYIDGSATEWNQLSGYGARGPGMFWEFGGLGHRDNFVYASYPLPRSFTEGKSQVTLRICAAGQTNHPSHGIYAAYTHTAGFFTPPADEPQGEPFEWGPAKPKRYVSEEKEEKLKERAVQLINQVLKDRPKPSEQRGARLLEALSDAYHAEWSDHYRSGEIVEVVKEALDAAVRRQSEKGVGGHMGGHKWHYQGVMARCLAVLWDGFEKSGALDEQINHDGDEDTDPIPRRDAYDWYFQKGFEWRTSEDGGRREVSNQSMGVSRSLYRMQKALQLLGSDAAWPAKDADRYIYEALGMAPFYAPYPRRDWVRAVADAGFPWHIITSGGLALEGGHASGYGELAVSRAARLAEELGDPAAKERAEEIVRARMTAARRPGNDGAGYAALQRVFPFTFRGRSYPGGIQYVNHETEFTNAAILEDPVSLRLAELYLEHGQFSVHTRKDRVVRRVDDYLKVKKMLEEKETEPLPIEPEHPDFGWADEGSGVFAFKHGDTLVYGSFVLTMPGAAVVPVARVLHSTPRIERLADVMAEIKVPETDEHISPGGILEGTKFPRTPPPPELDSGLIGQWRSQDIRASMAYFYTLHYGNYLIAMNTTEKGTYRERSFRLNEPDGLDCPVREALDLVSGEMIDLTRPVRVRPESTMILYLGE